MLFKYVLLSLNLRALKNMTGTNRFITFLRLILFEKQKNSYKKVTNDCIVAVL
jgi:hypothetical protein